MKRIPGSKWMIVSLFAIAMGIFECIVVVYLRELYYPAGFAFPLKPMKAGIIGVEILRETATLVMLLTVGMLAGRSRTEKFAWFIYAFAIWDIIYYLFLKLLIGWPPSLMTWDILFLIPTTWVGPVLGPLLNSFTMIVLAVLLLPVHDSSNASGLKKPEWFLLITGSLAVIIAYTKDYSLFLLARFSLPEILNPANGGQLMEYAGAFVPKRFSWEFFIPGMILHWLAIVPVYRRRLTVK